MLETLIHIGKTDKGLLFLKKTDDHTFTWFNLEATVQDGKLMQDFELASPTQISATTPQEAIRLARREWKKDNFRTIKCGFRYTLPERDEHGDNALFHHMRASLSSMNGQYFDEELQHFCYVQNFSLEAKELMDLLQETSC